MRKLISILLCACLLFSFAMLSATAAEEGDDVLKNAKWVLGQYDYSTGKFIEYNSRIAAEDKLSVNPGDEFSFDTGCDDDGVSFVLRGYDSADNFVNLANTSAATAIFKTGDTLIVPERVFALSVTIYDEDNSASTRGQQMLDMISDGTLVPSMVLTKVAPPTTAPVTKGYVETTYDMEQLSDSMRLLGRSVMDGTTLSMSMTASGFEFKATCEGDITFRLTSSASGYIDVIVDEDFNNALRITIDGPGKFTADTNMSAGVHKIRIVRASEHNFGYFTFKSVTINGAKYGAPPAEKGLKLEFYGDSITAGYGNISSGSGKWSWQFQDGYQTYASYCAQELDADFSAIAASGHGVIAGNDNRTKLISTYWDKTGINGGTWDFSYDADIVVINLGTNDHSYFNNKKIVCDETEFKNGCRSFISNIRSRNDDCQIIWVYGMNWMGDSDYQKIPTWLGELDGEYDYLNVVKISTGQSGGDSHPNVAQHKAAGKILADYITKLYTDNDLTLPENPKDTEPSNPIVPSVVTTSTTTTTTTTTTVTNPNYTIGDVNSDGNINGKDVLQLRKYIVKLVGEDDITLAAADCNRDGSVNGKDVLQLRKYIVKLIKEL